MLYFVKNEYWDSRDELMQMMRDPDIPLEQKVDTWETLRDIGHGIMAASSTSDERDGVWLYDAAPRHFGNRCCVAFLAGTNDVVLLGATASFTGGTLETDTFAKSARRRVDQGEIYSDEDDRT